MKLTQIRIKTTLKLELSYYIYLKLNYSVIMHFHLFLELFNI